MQLLMLSLASLCLPGEALGRQDERPAAEAGDDRSTRRSEQELEQDGWILLDGVIAQAGDEVVTLGGLERFLVERMGPDTDQEQARAAAPRALQTLETILLETQAGEDLGIPRAEIERIIQSNLDARRRNSGVRGYLDYLEEEGLDPRAAIASQSRELYRILWTRERLGIQAAGGRRIQRDAFLRPGTLRAFFEENQDALGEPPRVRFQRIAIGAQPPGDVESARQEALEVIQRLGEGESFQDLLIELGDEDPVYSLENWQAVPELAQVNPDLAVFSTDAPEGSIFPEPLPAFPIGEPGGAQPQQLGWFIYRLNDRVSGSPPPFESRETQTRLRRLLEDRWRGSVLARERERLQAASYRWRHVLFGGGGGAAPEVAGPPLPR